MGIGSEPAKPFIVPLKKLSKDTVKNVFMVIEEPENPIIFPEKKAMAAAIAPEYHTIGEFYEAVSQLISDLGSSIFTGDPAKQVTGYVGADELFAVTDVATAQEAIHIIVVQGEGTATSPVGGPEGVAHYYRFEEIYRGQTLSVDSSVPEGYSWGPPPIALDLNGVIREVYDGSGYDWRITYQLPVPPPALRPPMEAWVADLLAARAKRD